MRAGAACSQTRTLSSPSLPLSAIRSVPTRRIMPRLRPRRAVRRKKWARADANASMATTTVPWMEAEWLDALRADGPRRDAAIARLHELLLRASRFEVARRRTSLPHLRGESLDDLAT